jgi:hypothetical protein
VACLYCGKELGPLQLLRSQEYCCAEHRKLYQERLGRVLNQIGSDDPVPTLAANFAGIWPLQIGIFKQLGAMEFHHRSLELRMTGAFPLAIAPVIGGRPALLEQPTAAAANHGPAPAEAPLEARNAAALPGFALQAVEETGAAGLDSEAFAPPSLCGIFTPVPPAEPALCDVAPTSRLSWHSPPASLCYPDAPANAIAGVAPVLAGQWNFAPWPAAQPVEFPLGLAACCEPLAPILAVGLPAGFQGLLEPAAVPGPVEAPLALATTGSIAGAKPFLPAALVGLPHAIATACEPVEAAVSMLLPVPAQPAPHAAVVPGPMDTPLAAEQAGYIPAQAFTVPAADALPAASLACGEPLETETTLQLPAGLPPELDAAAVSGPVSVPALARTAGPSAARWSARLAAAMNIALPRPKLVIPDAAGELSAPAMAASVPMAPVCELPAMPVESLPRVKFAAVPRITPFALYYPELGLAAQAPAAIMAELDPAQPAAAVPPAASVSPATLVLMPGFGVQAPQPRITAPMETSIQPAPPVPLEFYCRHANALPVLCLSWMMPALPVRRPRMPLAPVLEPLEQRAPAHVPRRKKDAAAEVFKMPGARKPPSWLKEIAKPLAACFLVGGFLWLTATAMHVGTHTAAVNRDVATLIQAEREITASAPEVAGRQGNSRSGRSAAASQGAPSAAQPGLMTRVRQTISSRAASQITESFQEGMAAWGGSRKTAAPAWQRNPEGYVRPLAFALFRPSLDYRDYRMEFFGQIEQKSMSWAVRARDPQNYYGMKFTVVEPGLRPMVAIEHYAVVDGRKGLRTRVPLPQLMFHNNTPYHVEVAVRGNRVTTSVEGQEVDSWLDDALPKKGGVGFFAEAGERARLYWIKVARNEDFLGRICAYLSGSTDNASSSAELWPPSGAPAGSGHGMPPDRADVALAAVFAFGSSQQRRRSDSWRL